MVLYAILIPEYLLLELVFTKHSPQFFVVNERLSNLFALALYNCAVE